MEKGRLFSLSKASESALSNKAYRRVLYTTKELQYVEMHLRAGQEIGREMHKDTTQYFYVHGGDGVARVDGRVFSVSAGSVFIVPAGVMHNLTASSGKTGLWLHTTYSPPHHPEGLVQEEKKS